MALPVIVFNTSTGSDTAASGAGPATALSGTGASVNGTTAIDLSADAPDLSGVATDGSAAIWVATSSGRQFFKITAVDNGTKIVTVANAATPTESGKNWGIGGKRNSFDATSNRNLFSTSVLPGWIIETETAQSVSASTITAGVSGDTTTGRIQVRGASGQDHPTITQSANAPIFTWSTIDYWHFKNLKFANSNATKTSASGLSLRGVGYLAEDCIFGDATNKLLTAMNRGGGSVDVELIDCEITTCSGDGIDVSNVSFAVCAHGCWVHDCTGNGIEVGASSVVSGCVIEGNGGDGINAVSAATPLTIIGNTVNGNTGDGLDTSASAIANFVALNNIFSNNGGYGWRANAGQFAGYQNFNNYYLNTSGTILNAAAGANDLALDPSFTNSGGNDFSIGTNLKAGGFPSASRFVGANNSATTSYVDIGGAQRKEKTGGYYQLGVV